MKLSTSIKGALAAAFLLLPTLGQASGGGVPLPQEKWSFTGMFATFDEAALKRGAQVVTEVCMNCHGVKYIKYDHLKQIGFTETQVKEMSEAAGRTKKDRLLSALDDAAAKDSFGVIPPDLSLMTKARKGFEDYLYGILTGYIRDDESAMIAEALADEKLSEDELKNIAKKMHMDSSDLKHFEEIVHRINNGDNFNRYFPGYFFAMPQPLMADQLEYHDKTKATLEQLAHDTTTFLAWAAEPTLLERKAAGWKVLIYLVILTAMLYAAKRRIWAKIHH